MVGKISNGISNGSDRASASTYSGLLLVTLATLMYEIGLTRIFSVTIWYHFAFVAISVALFGMTVGALLVHHLPERFPHDGVKTQLARYSLYFALAIPPSFLSQLALPFSPHLTAVGLWSVVLTCVVISIPFIFSGIVVALALTRFPSRVGRLYAADLIGAAIGCIAFVLLLNRMDGPSAIIAISAIAAVGAACFALEADRRRGLVVALGAVFLFSGFALINATTVNDGNGILKIIWAKEARDSDHRDERWNAFSRVTVDGEPPSIVIDTTAGTALPPNTPEFANLLRRTLPNLVHGIRSNSDVLVIGSGGGSDVRSALIFDQKSVTGVEINPLVLHFANNVYGDYTGNLDRDPRVTFVNDEARSYIERTDKKFDIIQISLIDTWAAQGAGAFALSENSLYTTEAWRLFLSRLKPNGVLSVTRFYKYPGINKPLEMYRTVALGSQALTEIGIKNPKDHILAYRTETNALGVQLGNILLSREAFSSKDRLDLEGISKNLSFSPVVTADKTSDPYFAKLVAPGGPRTVLSEIAEDVSPPSDNRPYFFQMANLNTFRQGSGLGDDYVTRPVLVLALLGVAVLLMAIGLIALPLLLSKKKKSLGKIKALKTYFAAIGFGFMLIEVSQLQRMSIFLGNPTLSLSVVLFSVLLFSGLGSMATEKIVTLPRPKSFLVPFVFLLTLAVAYWFIAPMILEQAASYTTPIRAAIAVALLAPLSLALGMPFVTGIRAAATRANSPTAFLWGVNGAASVCGSVFGVVISVFFGIAAAFWTGVAAYVVAACAMWVISQRQLEPESESADAQSAGISVT